MGFTSLKKNLPAPVRKPDCVVDLSLLTGEAEGENVLRFRELSAADVFAVSIDEHFLANYPDLSDPNFAAGLLSLAQSYVPDEEDEEAEIDPLAELADLARKKRDVYLYVYQTVSKAFPTMNIEAEIERQKNAKRGAETPAGDLCTVPAQTPVAG